MTYMVDVAMSASAYHPKHSQSTYQDGNLSDTNNKKRTIHVDDIGVRKLTMDVVSNCHKQPAIAINNFFKISGYYRIFHTKKKHCRYSE